MGIESFVDRLGGVSIDRVDLTDADLSGAVTADWNVHESRFTNCDFSRSRGEFCFGSGREMSEYVDCRFDHSRISAVTAGRARFIRCSFRDVLITKWLSSEVEILDCTFSGKIREMSFRADVPSEDQALLGRARNRFERNDLSRAELKGVAFSGGVDLQNQILPTGDGYVLVERADVVLPAVFTEVSGWPDSAVKKAVMTPLTVQLKWYVGYGQRQVLFSPLDWISRDGTKEQAYKALLPLLHKHAIRASSE
ncbi:MAG TPA: hypothetical protein VGN48_00210 [Pedococcus sp.]|nr:hypothetical protein [Pedococcus sp.]